MADSSFGLKIGLEGEREFKLAITDINREMRVLGSEMKLVASQFDKNDKSAAALTSRNQVLGKEIEAQKSKIQTLKSALDNSATSFGENDSRTKNWQIQRNNAQATLNGLEGELKENNSALSKFADEVREVSVRLPHDAKHMRAAHTIQVAYLVDGQKCLLGQGEQKSCIFWIGEFALLCFLQFLLHNQNLLEFENKKAVNLKDLMP